MNLVSFAKSSRKLRRSDSAPAEQDRAKVRLAPPLKGRVTLEHGSFR